MPFSHLTSGRTWQKIETCLPFTYKANSYTSEVKIHTRQEICHFIRYVANEKLYFVKKVSSRLPGLECSYGKIFIPVTKISVTGPVKASHMNTSNFLRKKDWRGEISENEPARLTRLI